MMEGHSSQGPVNLADLEHVGCGVFRLRPDDGGDQGDWITVKDAGALLRGLCSHRTLYPLLGEFLVYRRPLPAKVVVSKRSVLALKAAMQSGDFGSNRDARAELRRAVEKEMARIIESSIHVSLAAPSDVECCAPVQQPSRIAPGDPVARSFVRLSSSGLQAR